MIMGFKNAMSMLLGAVIGFGILGPIADKSVCKFVSFGVCGISATDNARHVEPTAAPQPQYPKTVLLRNF